MIFLTGARKSGNCIISITKSIDIDTEDASKLKKLRLLQNELDGHDADNQDSSEELEESSEEDSEPPVKKTKQR